MKLSRTRGPIRGRPSTWMLIVCLAAISSPTSAVAAGIEISPFVGFRLGGDFNAVAGVDSELDESSSFGLILDFPVTDEIVIEVLISRQETDLVSETFAAPELFAVTVDHYQVGALHEWRRQRKIVPFFGGTVGIAQFNPAGRRRSETRAAFSFGGGAKLFFTTNVGVRVDGRLYGSFFGGSRRLFCGDAGCQAEVPSSTLLQVEASAALILRF